MLHHIVLFKFKPETGDEQIAALEKMLDARFRFELEQHDMVQHVVTSRIQRVSRVGL